MIVILAFGHMFSLLLAIFKLVGVITWPWLVVAAPALLAIVYMLLDLAIACLRNKRRRAAWKASIYD